jgi:hypothetical protein
MYLLTPCGKKLHSIYCVLQIFYFLHTGHGGGMYTAALQWVNLKETRLLRRSKHSWQDNTNPYPQENKRIWTGFMWLIKRGKW